jgi:hypothetical protein
VTDLLSFINNVLCWSVLGWQKFFFLANKFSCLRQCLLLGSWASFVFYLMGAWKKSQRLSETLPSWTLANSGYSPKVVVATCASQHQQESSEHLQGLQRPRPIQVFMLFSSISQYCFHHRAGAIEADHSGISSACMLTPALTSPALEKGFGLIDH